MRHRHLLALPLTCLVLTMLGCPRLAPPAPDLSPPLQPETPPIAEVDAEYLEVADAFFSAIAKGEPASAYELLTDGARGFLTEEQFASGMSELNIASHNLAAHVVAGDAAYVVTNLESVEAVAPEAMPASAYGLLLRKADGAWRVGFFLPQTGDNVGMLDLTLTPGEEEGQYTILWVDADGGERYMAVTEF